MVGNVVPRRIARLLEAIAESPDEAVHLTESLRPLIAALSVETNPAPLKAMLARLGFCSSELRLPLVPLSQESSSRIERVLASCELV